MRRALLVPLVAALGLVAVPAAVQSSPLGGETNPLGTLRWLPRDANEKPAANQFRLVVVYDSSLDATGGSRPLLANGPFQAKFATPSPDVAMVGNSASVQDLSEATGQTALDPVDAVAIALSGDTRDGACSKLGMPTFSAAFSTTRSFFVPGSTPYTPISAPGACERVDSSVEIRDANGALLGFNTSVTTFAPGFWIDVTWPTRTAPGLTSQPGRTGPEVWYEAAYDSNADATIDASGASKSVGTPGDYTATFSFTANPGAFGIECVNTGGNGQEFPGTFQDVKVQVPTDATKVTFLLFPKGDWDLIVFNPNGVRRVSGNFGTHEQSVAPSTTQTGNINFPDLVPGEWTMRACNFTGEPSTFGAVVIE